MHDDSAHGPRRACPRDGVRSRSCTRREGAGFPKRRPGGKEERAAAPGCRFPPFCGTDLALHPGRRRDAKTQARQQQLGAVVDNRHSLSGSAPAAAGDLVATSESVAALSPATDERGSQGPQGRRSLAGDRRGEAASPSRTFGPLAQPLCCFYAAGWREARDRARRGRNRPGFLRNRNGCPTASNDDAYEPGPDRPYRSSYLVSADPGECGPS
jgi:hypothetical protein